MDDQWTSTAATATPAAATDASTAAHEVAPAEDTCMGCKSEICNNLYKENTAC